MIGLPNPYVMIAGAVALVGVSGTIVYQNNRIHHFHKMADDESVVVALREQKIKDMTDTQNAQTTKSEQAVIKVVQGPREVQSIIKEVQSAPAKPCAAPSYSDEVKNAF